MAVLFSNKMEELMTAFDAEALMAAPAPAITSVPPESVIAELVAKVMVLLVTLPLIVTVPAPKARVAVPKLTLSAAVVVTLPGTSVPPELVLHPCEALPVVGTAHVPPAVPKPAVAPLLSQ
jgi:hypothetical protein